MLNCNFKNCVWLWRHGFFPALEKSGLDLTSSDFIYYGKTWDGKKYLFTKVKNFCHLIWKTVCHLNFIAQCSSLSFVRGKRETLQENIQGAKAKSFPYQTAKCFNIFKLIFLATYSFAIIEKNQCWKFPRFQSQYLI